MIARPDPVALMAGDLGRWLGEQHGERAAIKAKVARIRRIAIVAGIAVGLAVAVFDEFGTGLQAGFAAGALLMAWAEIVKRPMLTRLKGGINGAVAQALGLKYAAEVTPGEAFERARRFDLVPEYENATFQDLWSGTVGERPFTLHEARLTKREGSGNSRRTVTLFEGSIMAIGFARMFHGTTLIEGDGRRRRFLIGSEKEECEISGEQLARADFVDPRFETRFTIWTSDQTEARYLVHPEYVERLLAVEEAFAGKNIRALFHGGELTIALETGNLFESGSLDAEDDRALLDQAIAQFGALADLAVQLNERERATMRSAQP